MSKKKKVIKTVKVVKKDAAQDKIARVMTEFRDGKLKSADGKTVTSKEQALAIALTEAGISNKSLEKAEYLLRIKQIKKSLEHAIMKAEAEQSTIDDGILNFLSKNPNPPDKDFHAFADKMGVAPDEMEGRVYAIMSDMLTGGRSGGKIPEGIDAKELAMGIKTEREHTKYDLLARKIAIDHLTEMPDYYTRLAKMEAGK